MLLNLLLLIGGVLGCQNSTSSPYIIIDGCPKRNIYYDPSTNPHPKECRGDVGMCSGWCDAYSTQRPTHSIRTGQPSRRPSDSPSGNPSVVPSNPPSNRPTSTPSGNPTSKPSTSGNPSSGPSVTPTYITTVEVIHTGQVPSNPFPSNLPSIFPTWIAEAVGTRCPSLKWVNATKETKKQAQ